MGLKQQSLLNGPLVKKRLKTLIGFYKNTPPCTPRAGVSVFMKSVCSSQSFCFTLSACGGLFYMLPAVWFLCRVCRLWNNLHLFFISLSFLLQSFFLNALIIFQLFYPSVSPSLFTLVSLIVDFTMDSICLTWSEFELEGKTFNGKHCQS